MVPLWSRTIKWCSLAGRLGGNPHSGAGL